LTKKGRLDKISSSFFLFNHLFKGGSKMRGTTRTEQRYELLNPEAATKPSKPAGAKSPKTIAIGAIILVAVILGILLILRLESTIRSAGQSPEEVATEALNALSAGKQDDFVKLVEIKSFASRMDPTGVTGRDYIQADPTQTKELETTHAALLLQDIFVSQNTGRIYEITKQQIKGTSADISIKPWIQFGNSLYKRLLLEKRGEEWKVTGLTSPDI
jgi:hypothetical protein